MPANPDFASAFDFARAGTASYRNSAGDVVTVAVNAPRFDHDGDGNPLGLLVEGRPDTTAPDHLAVKTSAIEPGQAGTVLHEFVNHMGVHKFIAIHTDDGHATINARLACRGHHRRLVFFKASSPDAGGGVQWGGHLWSFPARLKSGADVLVSGSDHLTGAV